MNFISLVFLLFLLVSIIIYFITPKRFRWISLLVLSLICYFYAGWECALYLLGITLLTYLSGLLIGNIRTKLEKKLSETEDRDEKKKIRKKSENKSKAVVIITIVLLIALLAFIKYTNSFLSFLNSLSSNIPGYISILMPLGISFYLFQSLGYVIDVHRGTCECEKNFFRYLLFISYFPQLIQGPIERYSDMKEKLFEGHDFDSDRFSKGIERIIIGFLKKVVIADVLASFVNTVKADPESEGIILMLMLIAYSIELYADFSGFIDIALGISEIFGISLSENFQTPYLSGSIAEFWRRWHITLGTWFRDYVYYSIMTTSFAKKMLKKKKLWATDIITTLSLLAVWICMGLWHGSTLNFLIYGLYHGFFIITTNLLDPVYRKIKEKLHINDKSIGYRTFQVIRTFLIVTFGYVFFITDSLSASADIIVRMFSAFNPLLIASSKYLAQYSFSLADVLTVALAITILILYTRTIKAKKSTEITSSALTVQRCSMMVIAVLIIIFAWTKLYAAGDYTSDFVYFQF